MGNTPNLLYTDALYALRDNMMPRFFGILPEVNVFLYGNSKKNDFIVTKEQMLIN